MQKIKNTDDPSYRSKSAVLKVIYDPSSGTENPYSEFIASYGFERDFVSYFSDWLSNGSQDSFSSYARATIEQEQAREQLSRMYGSALKKLGTGTALCAVTWVASVIIPGGSPVKIALACISEKTAVGAVNGAIAGAAFKAIKGVIEGKTGDELILQTLDGAGNGCIVGAVTGLISGAAQGIDEASSSSKFYSTRDAVQRTGRVPDGYVGGRVFQNREGRLPKYDSLGNNITYHEYDVNLHIPGVNRGAERLIIGSDGSGWKTTDHYSSFTRLPQP